MLSEERRREIMGMLRTEGRVLVRELSKHFRTSQITVRKDLEYLHHEGHLERTHGGALPNATSVLQDSPLREKERQNRPEKIRIAGAAVKKIRPGQVIILDSGTTTTAVARACRNTKNLTIITNAMNIAGELAGSSVEVILTGGVLRQNSFSLVGPLAEESLRKLSADLLFLGVDGFDVRYGLTTPNLLEARVNRVMTESAKRTIVVCDSSKFGRRSLSLIIPASAVRETITDKNISKRDLKMLREAGVEVTLV
ncbi:MAG: transcriptional repressor AgaR [Candidatus Acidiferrales bacterium]|jgi:DeoR family transcriptional regulator of aga operon